MVSINGNAGDRRKRALWASTSARGGISTYVMTMRNSALNEAWDVRYVSTHSNGSLLVRLWLFARGIAKFTLNLVFWRPHVVHLHISHYGSFYRKALLAWLAKMFGRPVIRHVHGSRFHEFFSSSGKESQFFIRLTLESASAVVALGETWAGRLRAVAPATRIEVIPNAVRLDRRIDQPELSTVHFAFLGEIGERKGAFVLLEAWAEMVGALRGRVSAQLTLAGDGEIHRAEALVNDLGLEGCVSIRGWISAAEVDALLRRSQVLVLPSQNEGQPMAILEAMAKGLCVIASNVGGIPEMLSGEAGILVSPDHVSDLANVLRTVVEDSSARAAYGLAAWQAVRDRFDIAVTTRRLCQLYSDVI